MRVSARVRKDEGLELCVHFASGAQAVRGKFLLPGLAVASQNKHPESGELYT